MNRSSKFSDVHTTPLVDGAATPDEALAYCLQQNMTDVMVAGYGSEGCFMIICSDMSNEEALMLNVKVQKSIMDGLGVEE